MRRWFAITGLYLGAAVLATGWMVGNCTQDSTDALLAGSMLGLGLTAASGALLASRPLTWLALTVLAPAFLMHLLQVSRASEATVMFLALDRSFCAQMHGLPYGPSGDEPLLITVWAVHAAVVTGGLAATLAWAFDRPPSPPRQGL